jgi:hypothetical protein
LSHLLSRSQSVIWRVTPSDPGRIHLSGMNTTKPVPPVPRWQPNSSKDPQKDPWGRGRKLWPRALISGLPPNGSLLRFHPEDEKTPENVGKVQLQLPLPGCEQHTWPFGNWSFPQQTSPAGAASSAKVMLDHLVCWVLASHSWAEPNL